jgi:pimeloyl-ACP methyl ester carboxylesterase
MPLEKSFFFREGDRPLYGMLYTPDPGGSPTAPAERASRGVVICDSLFEENLWSERVDANLARHLSAKGFTVLVFDYFGYGNSVGRSIEVDVESLERDVEDACNLLTSAGINRLSLVGVRWGAALASRAAAARTDVDGLVLINPVRKWKTEFMKALRANVAGQYAIFKKTAMTREEIIGELTSGGDCVRSGYRMNHIDGYFFSSNFHQQLQNVVVPVELPPHVKSVKVVTIPEKKTSAPTREDKLVGEFQSAGVNCDGITLEDDNAFWINNDIFTSVAPGLNREAASFLEDLEDKTTVEKTGLVADPTVFETISNNGIRETAVSFESSDGVQLFGVLYLPDSGAMKDLSFLCSHGGLIGMNGAFRFNTRAARRFAKDGYPSLCFDPHGMGKSRGPFENADQLEFFWKFTHGELADDVGDAARYLKNTVGDKQVVAFGVCGGAITNHIAHGRYDSIDVSLPLSIPVLLPRRSRGGVRMTEGYAKFYLSLYTRKLFNPVAWWRFATFQSEYKYIFKALRTSVGSVFKRSGSKRSAVKAKGGADDKPSSQSTTMGLGFNDMFLEAYRNIIARGDRIIFFHGGNDNFKYEFFDDFVDKYPKDVEAGKDLVTVKEIEHANHMYTLREWQDEICDYCLNWAETACLPKETPAE